MSSHRLFVLPLLALAGISAGCDFLSAEEQGSSLPKAKAQRLATGRLHACALTTEGGVRCWGYAHEGRLGDGKVYVEAERLPAVQVVGLESGVSYLASGPISDFTCAIVGGGIKCWGEGSLGALGNGRAEVANAPVEVTGISDATMVAVGGFHACALRAGGKISCWGDNESGQLGDGTTTLSKVPVAVPGLSGATAVAAGYTHTCALMAGGKVMCWGNNTDVQCGQAEGAEFLEPVEVPGLTGVVELMAAGSNTCALTSAGGLLCWGSNRYGQLGDGTGGNPFDERAEPAAVLGLASGVTSAATGSIFGLAVVDGAVRMWGSFRGEELEPIAGPAFPSPPTSIAAGQSSERGYGCGITAQGTYCWGDNSGGVVGPYESDDGQYFEEKPLPVSSLD